MEVLSVLDVLIHVFDAVFGKGRSQDAAIAESTMAKFGAALEPGHNLIPERELDGISTELLFARGILVNDLAVVYNCFHGRGRKARAQVEMSQGLLGIKLRTLASSQNR